MGLLSGWNLAARVAQDVIPAQQRTAGAAAVGVISPWQSGSLSPIVASDVWGLAAVPMSPIEMMRVPAVVKARAVLHALISRPLRARGADGQWLPDAQQPTWLYRTNSGVAPEMRLKLILDDLIFREASLLRVQRSTSADAAGRRQILDAVHVAWERWHADPASGVIEIDGTPVDGSELIWIPGPGPGLVHMAAEVARGSRRMAEAWVGRVESPFPLMELHETEDLNMDDDEIRDWLDAVLSARENVKRAAFFTPHNIQAISHAGETVDLFEGGRNAERLDWANYFALPSALLDGSVATASLTYSTQEGRRNEVFDYTVPYWLDPITSRLSMDDVVPRGQSIRMDFSDLLEPTAPAAGATTQD